MRLIVFGIFSFSFFLVFGGAPSIPQVPSSIEIAGVKLKITSDAQQEIQKSVNALRASDKYFRIKLDRVNLYFPIVERVLREEGVPEDLKYLAIQESALISDAVSSANAVGYWQFKDFTALEVGLRVDAKVDERKNIVSATRGAAKYFKRNNFFFKNWIYSVSAYQAGPGGAKQYVNKAYFGSDKLTITSKTHWYVLKYIAHVIAFQDEIGAPHSEGLKLGEYTKGEGKSIDQVARELKSDEELTKEYNKWLKHGKIPDDKVYTVIVPLKGKLPKQLNEDTRADNSSPPLSRSIKDAQPAMYPDNIAGETSGRKTTIFFKINGKDVLMASPEDNLKSLAKKAGLDLETFMDFNDLSTSSQVKSGEIYYANRKGNRSTIHYHIAQYNETLWGISQKYGIKVDKLAKKNRMDITEVVTPGRLMWLRKNRPRNKPVEYHQVTKPKPDSSEKPVIKETRKPIIITPEPAPTPVPNKEATIEKKEPEKEKIAERPKGERILHVIQPGETLWSIGEKYKVTIVNIVNWNSLDAGAILSPGEELLIYSDRTELAEADENTTKSSPTEVEKKSKLEPTQKEGVNLRHTIKKGESLWSISRNYDVTVEEISQWNELKADQPIKPGQEIIVGPSQQAKVIDPPNKPASSNSNHKTYVVKSGDNLYQIAREHGLTVEELMKLNNLDSTVLAIGDELKVIKD